MLNLPSSHNYIVVLMFSAALRTIVRYFRNKVAVKGLIYSKYYEYAILYNKWGLNKLRRMGHDYTRFCTSPECKKI